ncbi:MAG: UPF0104 family protein, partial [Phycisphaerae bacterium]|nr:UPF0104 family protein [Phycisphaerae bacterium]
FRAMPIALAAIFLTIIYAARTLSFRLLLKGYGPPPGWRGVAVVAWVPQLAKYVPGQVVSVLGAVGLLRKYGVPAAIGLSVVLVMDGLAVLTGLVSGSPLLLWAPVKEHLPHGWILCLLVIIAGGIALSPRVLGRLINFALAKARKAPLQSMPPVRNYIGPVLLGFAQWMLAGLALWCTAWAITDVSFHSIFLFIAIASLGYTAGYVSPLPGGVGVRDLIFQTTLTFVIGPAAALTVVTVRVIQTIVELVMAGAGIWIYRRTPDAAEERVPH